MCGRYVARRADPEVANIYGATVVGDPPGPSYNVAPTQQVRVVLDRAPAGSGETTDHHDGQEDHGAQDGAQRQLRSVRWGLIPSWAKDKKIGNRLVNARSESITEKPAFKRAAARRRCVVPADGYYEWEATADGKQPYFLHLDEQPLSMAGLYELWPDPDKEPDDPARWVWTMTVLTTTATDAAGQIHERSPLVLPDGMIDDWLNPTLTDLGAVRELVAAVPNPELQPYPVSRDVNNVRNNRPDLLQPVHA
jgi:putative SOS response-associated peptidase YedK